MPKAKNETPLVTTFPDYEVIQPPNKLKKAVGKAKPGTPADDPVARALEDFEAELGFEQQDLAAYAGL